MHWSKGPLPGIIRYGSATSSGTEAEGVRELEREWDNVTSPMHSRIQTATLLTDIYCANIHTVLVVAHDAHDTHDQRDRPTMVPY